MGSQIYIKRPCALHTPPSGKKLTCAEVLAYTYITVKLQHRSSINVRLTENSLSLSLSLCLSLSLIVFALNCLQKWVLGDLDP